MKKILLAIMLLFVSQSCMDVFAKTSKKTHKKNKSNKTHKKKKPKKTNKKKQPKKTNKKKQPKKINKQNKKNQSGFSLNKVGGALGKIKEGHNKALEAKSMAENVRDGGVDGALGKAKEMGMEKINQSMEGGLSEETEE